MGRFSSLLLFTMDREKQTIFQLRVGRGLLRATGVVLVLGAFLWVPSPLQANPTGGTVAAGSAAISSSGSTVTVQQGSDKAIINWQNFSIGSGETTTFVQPSAASMALNRVMGGNPSAIYGALNANGQIYLINPNGILVGPGGAIHTAGFLASTLDTKDADFLAGGNIRFQGASMAKVVNLGTIGASGGDIFLLAQQVENHGALNAPNGTDILVKASGTERLFIQSGSGSGTVTNGLTGTIHAVSAEIKAAGGNEFALAINNQGVIRATGVDKSGGRILLKAASGMTKSTGTLVAKNADGKGGNIETSGETVSISGTVLTGEGGMWLVDPIAISINADGDGTISLVTLIAALDAGGTVHEQAINGGSGTITVSSPVTWTGAGTLWLDSDGTITINAAITGTKGSLTLSAGGAGTPITGTGAISVGAFTLQQGNASLANLNVTGATLLSGNLTTTGGAFGTVDGAHILTINGPVTFNGDVGTGTNLTELTVNGAATLGGNVAISTSGYMTFGSVTGTGHSLTLSDSNRTTTIMASGAVNVGTFILQSGVWYQTTSTLPAFSATDFEIASGATFLRFYGGSGNSGAPYQIGDVYGLQGMGSSGLLGNYYILANDITASGTSGWNGGAGFIPIGTPATPFTGVFNGANHTITGLTMVSAATDVGLFGKVGGTGGTVKVMIENVTLANVNITATGTSAQNVGGLVGYDFAGSLLNVHVAGTVVGSASASSSQVGGVAGQLDDTYYNGFGYYASGNTVSNASFSGTVSDSASNDSIGGLSGSNYGYSVATSSAAGRVLSTGSGSFVGGLIGSSNGVDDGGAAIYLSSLTTSYSTGSVSGTGIGSSVGGLVGFNTGTISSSYAMGSVAAGSGTLDGLKSYAGGLVGQNGSTGLTGANYGIDALIANTYATGTVSAGNDAYVGGLVGANLGGTVTAVRTSYATGAVTGGSRSAIGALVGTNGSVITSSYWDSDVLATGIGGGALTGATGLTNTQMGVAGNFTGLDFSTIWTIQTGVTSPYFIDPVVVVPTLPSLSSSSNSVAATSTRAVTTLLTADTTSLVTTTRTSTSTLLIATGIISGTTQAVSAVNTRIISINLLNNAPTTTGITTASSLAISNLSSPTLGTTVLRGGDGTSMYPGTILTLASSGLSAGDAVGTRGTAANTATGTRTDASANTKKTPTDTAANPPTDTSSTTATNDTGNTKTKTTDTAATTSTGDAATGKVTPTITAGIDIVGTPGPSFKNDGVARPGDTMHVGTGQINPAMAAQASQKLTTVLTPAVRQGLQSALQSLAGG